MALKENTKRNSHTFKRCRGPATSTMRTTRQQKWSKQRYSSFRNELRDYLNKGEYEWSAFPSSKNGRKRSLNQSPKDAWPNSMITRSKKEIERDYPQFADIFARKKQVSEPNVINGLRHGERKLTYNIKKN
jgi:hypothetical protein